VRETGISRQRASAWVGLVELPERNRMAPNLAHAGLLRGPSGATLLRYPQGDRLRAIARVDDSGRGTAKALAWLRANYTKPFRPDELAAVARMGVSTLNHHFRTATSLSPLQYHKQLRLMGAREKMLVEGVDATRAAFDVGYESASQFTREYKRLFGQPPMRDVKSQRLAS
jgi:AraC-like DNA-binding protein